MTRYITRFEGSLDGTIYAAEQIQSMDKGRPLFARYDLPAVAAAVDRDALSRRPENMWRYRELLPVGDEIEPVSLCEDFTPMIQCPGLGKWLGLERVTIKDESRLPGLSFKARGLSLAVTMARHFGISRIAMASNGNAGGAMAAYAARAGIDSVMFVPQDTPRANIAEAINAGSLVWRADGLIDDCGKKIRQGHDRGLWFDISTMKEPYRLEGKKTMGLELADQLGWKLPDVIVFPTGGGTALIAMWKAFQEMCELGWLETETFPRLVSVQSTGCQPLVRAFQSGERFATRYENAHTLAAGLRVPGGIGDFLVLDAVRASGGVVIAGEEERIFEWQAEVGRREGIMLCPESATCIGAVQQMVSDGRIAKDEHVVFFNTAAGQKYLDYLDLEVPGLCLEKLDWDNMTNSVHAASRFGRQSQSVTT